MTTNQNIEKLLNKSATHPLQTWQWAQFRKQWGNQIYPTTDFLLTIHPLPIFKNYKIGTLIRGNAPTKNLLNQLKDIAKQQNLIFIKLEPNVLRNDKDIKILKQNGCVPGKTLFTPTSFWIDLTKSEEDLLKSFHHKTRYNIKVAQKHGVVVKEDNSDEAFKKYITLYKETTQRQGFYAHSEKYHRLMWQTLHKDMVAKNQKPIARLLTATYNNEIIACWILFVWKEFVYYPYGASTDKYKQVMASTLMMWEAIRYGKSINLRTFDLWGREEGKGFTKFKEGFSPHVVEFLGTWDLPTSHLYGTYRVAEQIRWKLLRLKAKLIKPTF